MIFSTENILLIGSILLFISIIAGKTSFKVGVPTLIFFLVVGMLAGSEGLGNIYFDDPKTAQFIGILALNFILFSGGLDTKWEQVKPVMRKGIVLSTLGVLLTACSVGVFVHIITDFSLMEGLLLGSIVSSTDAAAVFSVLRSKSVGLKNNLKPTLELESGSNDPMAFFLTISLTSMVAQGEGNIWTVVPTFFLQMIVGGAAGYLMGKLMVRILNKISLDFEGLYPVMMIAMLFFTFSITDVLGGNGFLAVYLSGLVVNNNSVIHKKSLIRFFDGMAWLMQIVLFLTLGLLVFPSQIIPIMGMGILIALFLIFIARPISVFASLMFFKLENSHRLFISWVGLRGAVPIVFATYPLLAGVEKANMIFNLVFFIAVISVLLQGTTLPVVARWLGVTVPGNGRRAPTDMELSDDVKSELVEIEVPHEKWTEGKKIVDLGFPKTALIVLIKRKGKFITPNGSTIIYPGDKLLIMSDSRQALDDIYQCMELKES